MCSNDHLTAIRRRERAPSTTSKAAVSRCSKTVFLLDNLVSGHLHDQRYREAERLRRFEIDDEFELRGLLHRKLGGLLTLEDAIDIEGRLAELVVYVHSIREEAARIDILTASKGRRQSRRLRKLRDPPALFDFRGVWEHHYAINTLCS